MKAPRFSQEQYAALVTRQGIMKGLPGEAGSYASVCDEKPVKAKKRRVERTRNAGTWTEAHYWGVLRSGLRRLFRFWKPAVNALNAARVPHSGPRGQRWAYVCADCKKLFLRKDVQIDHVEPVGKLLDYADVGDFLRRLTPEDPEAFRTLCKTCHLKKTKTERP